jgi:hypothetical protein
MDPLSEVTVAAQAQGRCLGRLHREQARPHPTKKPLRIEDKVNSHSILSKLCFLKVPVPSLTTKFYRG